MCGRFVITSGPEELWKRFRITSGVRDLSPRYNLAPSQDAPVVIASPEGRRLSLMRWGLVPAWADDIKIGYKLINARAETASSKPSFRQAFRQSRCLVLSNGFFEWQRRGNQKLPYFFHRKDSEPMAYAGLWERWQSPEGEELHSFSILTTEANSCVQEVHSRMPVILLPENEVSWLNPHICDPKTVNSLITTYPADLMEAYQVSPLVNKPQNDDIKCIERAVNEPS